MWHHHYGSSHWCQWTPNLYFRVFFRHYSAADRIVFVEPDRNLIFRRNWFRLIECFSVRSRKSFSSRARDDRSETKVWIKIWMETRFLIERRRRQRKWRPRIYQNDNCQSAFCQHNNGKNTICGLNIRHKNSRSSILFFGSQIARK